MSTNRKRLATAISANTDLSYTSALALIVEHSKSRPVVRFEYCVEIKEAGNWLLAAANFWSEEAAREQIARYGKYILEDGDMIRAGMNRKTLPAYLKEHYRICRRPTHKWEPV